MKVRRPDTRWFARGENAGLSLSLSVALTLKTPVGFEVLVPAASIVTLAASTTDGARAPFFAGGRAGRGFAGSIYFFGWWNRWKGFCCLACCE